MAIDVLRHGVDNDICTMIQWILNVWAQKGIVHHHHDSMLMSHSSNIPDVHQAESGIARAFNPNKLCIVWSDQLGNVQLDTW